MISPQIRLSDRPPAGDRTSSTRARRRGVVSFTRSALSRFVSPESPPTNETLEGLENVANCSSDRSLAKGILRQTARDLRRFSGARTPAQHELYTDAYSWLMANEFAWPCSFLNVCATLGLQPEQTRADLIDAATQPWYSHVLTVAHNTVNSFASIL